jgi:putative hydrolases of HD superfamily
MQPDHKAITERLAAQMGFIVEIDKLKRVYRQTYLMDRSRKENDAEHSWHLAVMAILLSEYAAEPDIDVLRVVEMVLAHDLVEIDAGDTFCYDAAGNARQAAAESKAADRIFAMLPEDQCRHIRTLWDEFESRLTPEAKFAAALDRLQPVMHNYNTEGAAWREHGVTLDMVLTRNRHIAEGSPALWEYARDIIEDAVRKGYLSR